MALSTAQQSLDLNVGVENASTRSATVAYSDFNSVNPLQVAAYIEANIGVENVSPLPFSVMYADFNVGIEAQDEREGLGYIDIHIGLEQKPRIGAEYSDYNIYIEPQKVRQKAAVIDFDVVTDEVPTPHIWYVVPQRGKEGLLFNIVGMGFGVSQDEFNGKVRLGEIEAQATQWELFPAQKQNVLRGVGYLDTSVGFDSAGAFNRFAWFSPRAYWDGTSWTGAKIAANAVTLKTGDIIELDYTQLHADTLPGENFGSPQTPRFTTGNYSEIEIIPFFQKLGAPNSPTSVDNEWWITDPKTWPFMSHVPPHFHRIQDQNGWPMNRSPFLAQGETVHRRFVVPSEFNNMLTVNWGMAIAGGVAVDGRPMRQAEFKNFVIRNPDETPKFWVTGDDGSVLNYRSGVVDNSAGAADIMGTRELYDAWTSAGVVYRPATEMLIDNGKATVEHEWIIAQVPDGAESGMVRVVLDA